MNIEPATIKRLAEIDNIIGVKEASGNISQMAALLDIVPEEFIVLSGDDGITLPLLAIRRPRPDFGGIQRNSRAR